MPASWDGATQWLFWTVVAVGGAIVAVAAWESAETWLDSRRRQRRQEAERQLDRKQRELRRAVLRLAEAIATERAEADDASEALVRARFLSRGELPVERCLAPHDDR